MKITLDIPDSSICAFISLVYRGDYGGLTMYAQSMETKELYDGSEINVYPPVEEDNT